MNSHAHGRLFDPAQSHRLENPERPKYMPVDELVSRLEIASGMTVGDIGAGTGYFALPIARVALPNGKVLAVDMQDEMLEKLRVKLDQPGVPRNIDLVQGSATGTNLPSHVCDAVLIANVWHELDDQAATLKEMARILKPHGRLAILDWRPDVEEPPGPPLHHRVGMEQVRASLEDGRWTCDSAGPYGTYSYLIMAHRD